MVDRRYWIECTGKIEERIFIFVRQKFYNNEIWNTLYLKVVKFGHSQNGRGLMSQNFDKSRESFSPV